MIFAYIPVKTCVTIVIESRPIGAVHKVHHARGGGVQEGVTVCDRGEGSRACDVTLINFLSDI